METPTLCPKCHESNRIGARFCSKCGTPLATAMAERVTPAPVQSASAPVNARPGDGRVSGLLDKMLQAILPPGETTPLQPENLPGGYLRPQAAYRRYSGAGSHLAYFIVCNQDGKYYLTREATAPIRDPNWARRLAAFSNELPGLRPIQDVICLNGGRTFLVLRAPTQRDKWYILSDPHRPYSPDKAIRWGQQIGRGLEALHRAGFTLGERHHAGLDKVLVVSDIPYLTDLSTCAPMPADEAQRRQAVSNDVYYLTRVLYWALTSRNLTRDAQDMGRVARLPRALRVAILWGVKGSYVSISEMLAHLDGHNLPPLHLTSGKATHSGRVRDHNEDQFFVYEMVKGRSDQPLPAFYMVADGMGGHEAGEIASDTISVALKSWLDEFSNRKSGKATQRLGERPDEALRAAIQSANATVNSQAQARHNNMGATVTAALIVGEQVFVANVGDSRTYLYRNGNLRQITEDHSLVYRLYKANQISQEDIYTHPRRNQIYRSVGEKPEVDVDVFTEDLESGDLLLLCSDGLWEMVREASIKSILKDSRTPQEAAEQLIEAANTGGGEDNITAIVVKVE